MNAIVTVFKLLASVGTLYTTINYRILFLEPNSHCAYSTSRIISTFLFKKKSVWSIATLYDMVLAYYFYFLENSKKYQIQRDSPEP